MASDAEEPEREHQMTRTEGDILKGCAIPIVLGLVGMLAVAVVWLARVPSVGIRCSRDQQGRLIVDLDPDSQIRYIQRVTFHVEADDGDEHWWVLSHKRQVAIRRIAYGVLPGGVRQEQPADNVPPKELPSSGILYVDVQFQWDSKIPPVASSTSVTMKVQLTENGGVKHLGYCE